MTGMGLDIKDPRTLSMPFLRGIYNGMCFANNNTEPPSRNPVVLEHITILQKYTEMRMAKIKSVVPKDL